MSKRFFKVSKQKTLKAIVFKNPCLIFVSKVVNQSRHSIMLGIKKVKM